MSSIKMTSGYLDVKISSKSRRGLTPWKAWQKQWCEIRRLDCIENGVEIKLKSNKEGSVLSRVILPRSSTICRTDSRTKQYAFGVFNLGRNKKPILFLSGNSENDSQEWMSAIRKMLSIATYIPVGESNFRVSLVDNKHSRKAGLVGLFGVLSMTTQEIFIRDPCTGDPKVGFKWFHFHQFHLQVPAQPIDEKKVVVMHTSGEFPAGPGQIYLYCKDGSNLLHHLVARGKLPKIPPGIISLKRLSRSEGDLCCTSNNIYLDVSDSPLCVRSQTGSEDSGVRVSVSSDDSGYTTKSKIALSDFSIGMTLLTKTPGESETEESSQDLSNIDEEIPTSSLPRRKSGVSLASGIYEEIPDDHPFISPNKNGIKKINHVYENPLELILSDRTKYFTPPPLPPRRLEFSLDGEESGRSHYSRKSIFSPFKHRCNTLPAKDLSKISHIFTAESDYVVMSPSKTLERPRKTSITESLYMPMSPVIHLKNKIVESCYMSMYAKKT